MRPPQQTHRPDPPQPATAGATSSLTRRLPEDALAGVVGGTGEQTRKYLAETLKKGIYKLTHRKPR